MRVSYDYIAGFFDGEGSVSTMNFTYRQGLMTTVACISQTGPEGLAVLNGIKDFLWERGIKGYVQTQSRKNLGHRTMHHYKISARPSLIAFLKEMLPRVSVKHVVVQDTLRFYTIYPSLKGPVTAERNRITGKYGALNLNADELRADIAAGMTRTQLAEKHQTNTYTIHKYLDPDYRRKYDEYRKRWRAKRIAKELVLRAAGNAA